MKRTKSGQKRQGEQLSSQVATRRSRRSNPTSHTSITRVSTDGSAVVELSSNTMDINTIVKNISSSIMPQIESTVRRVVESHLSGLGLAGCENHQTAGLPVAIDKYGTDNVSVSTPMVISHGLRDGGDSSLVTGSGTTTPSSSGNNLLCRHCLWTSNIVMLRIINLHLRSHLYLFMQRSVRKLRKKFGQINMWILQMYLMMMFASIAKSP